MGEAGTSTVSEGGHVTSARAHGRQNGLGNRAYLQQVFLNSLGVFWVEFSMILVKV